jgi:hypothetical protein
MMIAKLIAAGMTPEDAIYYTAQYPDEHDALLTWVLDGTYEYGDVENADDYEADEKFA